MYKQSHIHVCWTNIVPFLWNIPCQLKRATCRPFESFNIVSTLFLSYYFQKVHAAWRQFCVVCAMQELLLHHHYKYAVKVQRSLAPLSRFRGSHIPSAHEQQCCRFQSYVNSVRSPMKFTSEIYIAWTTFLGSTTTDHELWRRTLTAYISLDISSQFGELHVEETPLEWNKRRRKKTHMLFKGTNVFKILLYRYLSYMYIPP